MTTLSLTDRYVDATLRRLPARQRPDIERELRASIADAVDDRIAGGESPTEAETGVLTTLGDPARLAAGYADRPLHLIGPALFVDYRRVLTSLLAFVVPVVGAVVAIVNVLDDDGPAEVIGSTISAAVTTAVHIAVWVTLFFAVLERVPGARWTPDKPWTPAALPAPPSRASRLTELILESVATVLFSSLILLSPFVSPVSDANGDPVPVLSPWLWQTGLVYVFLAFVVASLVSSFLRYYARWSVTHAVANVVVQAVPSLMLFWGAVDERILNPAFLAAVDWPEAATRWIAPGVAVIAIIGILSAIGETVRRSRTA